MEEIRLLVSTIFIELIIAALYLCGAVPLKRLVFVTVCVNLITHPIAWRFFIAGTPLLSIEICVIVFEMILFAALFPAIRLKAVAAAAAMNIVSTVIGLLVSML